MIFNSVTYLVFLGVVVSAYWLLPRNGRLMMLLASSIVFYSFWSVYFAPLMLISATIDYFVARRIYAEQDPRRRKRWLLVSLVSNLGLLVFFKYFYFLTENVVGVADLLGYQVVEPSITILLPIGISFYTFQTISYSIDVYRGFIKPEKNYLLFSNYVTFFPQLVAGPILRAGEVIWQLNQRPSFAPALISSGIQRVLIGLFLKVVLADNLAPIVDEGFDANPEHLGAVDTLTLGFLFGFQIYFDFAAYSHIAIGSALMMGIRFPENFNYPYLSTSPREFWKRWHISLSSWIRDYLYLPLTGTRVLDRSTGGIGAEAAQLSKEKTIAALIITWCTMGLWHGAGWNFVLWGLWHALLILCYRYSHSFRETINKPFRIVFGWAATTTFVMIGWIPFRAESLSQTMQLWSNLVSPTHWGIMGLRENTYLIAAIFLSLVLLAPLTRHYFSILKASQRQASYVLEVAALTFTFALTIIYLRHTDNFIYFQF